MRREAHSRHWHVDVEMVVDVAVRLELAEEWMTAKSKAVV